MSAIALRACLLGLALSACELIAPLDDVRGDDRPDASAGTGGGSGASGTAGGGAAGASAQAGASGGGAGGAAGCGDCAGGACIGGKCQPVLLASGQSGPEYPAVDATHVYWTNVDSVARTEKTGGAVQTLAMVGVQNEGCALDATHIYFADRGGHAIYQLAKAGGSPVLLASNQSFPQTVALDAGHVYWASEGDAAIRRVSKSGGPVEDLATGQTNAYAVALDGGELFWSRTTGQISKLSIASCCNVTPLVTASAAGVLSIAADSTHVYWVAQSGQNVQRVSRGGGAANEVGFVTMADGIAIDAAHVYVGQNAKPGSIHRFVKDGSTGDVPVTGQDHPRGIAVDDAVIYWANTDSGEIYKLAK
jgi:hypothetical protein